MAEYVQKGDVLDYTATSVLKFGDVVTLGTRIGVAGTDIAKGATGPVHVVGVFSFPVAEAINVGDAVYWDGSAITKTAAENTPAGYAFNSVTETDTLINVKIG